MRGFVAFLVLLSPVASSPSGVAQGPVLHEYVPEIDPDEPVRTLAEHGVNVEAIVQGSQVIEAADDASGSANELASDSPVMVPELGDGALGEQPGMRSPTFAPDTITELEGTLDYYETFKPVIAPFKRVTSLDATALAADRKTPVLAIADMRRRGVPIEGPEAKPPDGRPRDRFFGEVRLDFARGQVVPLPSVAPEARILELSTEPSVPLRIERDAADNFFAVLEARGAQAQPVRVSFLTDAPRSYFAGDIPRVPRDRLAREVPTMPAGVASRARVLAAEIGVPDGADLRDTLHALTKHFRAFEESRQPPENTGDVLADLVRGKKGVCRHRAYGFVVLAHALGIPARFVQNEAHSFVEVKLPEVGFRRIDLGGAAQGLRAHNAADAPVYQPSEPDTLPRPAVYEASYSQLGRNATGLQKPNDEALVGRWLPPASGGTSSGGGATPAFLSTTNGGGPGTGTARDERLPLSGRLLGNTAKVVRGRELEVQGVFEDPDGTGVAGLRVEVSFAAQGRRERMLLGIAVTDGKGVFEGRFGVPKDLSVGDYQLIVITPGDARHAPTLAR